MIYISYCSQYSNIFTLKNAKGKYCVFESFAYNKTKVIPYYNNREKLSVRYNEVINTLSNEDCVLVLIHDDVIITDSNWIEKIQKGLEKYDVVGLAGTAEATIRKPCLWHIMGPREKHTGAVNHVNFANNSTFTTYFGKPGRALILDGLFLAFNPKKIAKSGVMFDETNPCIAHFYDIDFSLMCNKHSLKLGTVNIQATHSSPGLKDFTQDWKNGEQWFLNKFNSGCYRI